MKKVVALCLALAAFMPNVFAQSYRGFVDITMGVKITGQNEKEVFTTNEHSYINNSPNVVGLVSTSHGVQLKNFFIGAGLGAIFTGDSYYNLQLPIFGDLRWDFFNSHRVTPFIGAKLGYSLTLGDAEGYIANMFYYQPSIGIRIRATRVMGVNIALTYFPSKRFHYDQKNQYPELPQNYHKSITKGFLGLSAGIDF